MKVESIDLKMPQVYQRDHAPDAREAVHAEKSERVDSSGAASMAREAVESGTSVTRKGSSEAQERTEEMNRQDLEQALQSAQDRFADKGVELKFRLNEESGDIQVEVLAAGSDKVVRKIPADELIHLSESLEEMAGRFLDRSF